MCKKTDSHINVFKQNQTKEHLSGCNVELEHCTKFIFNTVTAFSQSLAEEGQCKNNQYSTVSYCSHSHRTVQQKPKAVQDHNSICTKCELKQPSYVHCTQTPHQQKKLRADHMAGTSCRSYWLKLCCAEAAEKTGDCCQDVMSLSTCVRCVRLLAVTADETWTLSQIYTCLSQWVSIIFAKDFGL